MSQAKRGLQLNPPFLHLKKIHTNLQLQTTVRFHNNQTYPIQVRINSTNDKRYAVSPSKFNLMPKEFTSVTVTYCITSRARLDPRGIFHKRSSDTRGARDSCFAVQAYNQKGNIVDKFLYSAFITFFNDGKKKNWGAMFGNKGDNKCQQQARNNIEDAEDDDGVFGKNGVSSSQNNHVEYAEDEDGMLSGNNQVFSDPQSIQQQERVGEIRKKSGTKLSLTSAGTSAGTSAELSFHSELRAGTRSHGFMARMLAKIDTNTNTNTDTNTVANSNVPKRSSIRDILGAPETHRNNHSRSASSFNVAEAAEAAAMRRGSRRVSNLHFQVPSLSPGSIQKTNKRKNRPSIFSSVFDKDICDDESIPLEEEEADEIHEQKERTLSASSVSSEVGTS